MDYIERLRSGIEVRYTDPDNPAFAEAVVRANRLCEMFNSPGRTDGERFSILDDLFGERVDRSNIIKPPFHCDLGINIKVGKNDLINYDCIVLDCAEVTIGDHVLIGPRAQLLTPIHSMDYMARREVATTAEPIVIEDDVWMGGGVTVLPGVTIGARSVIGAGAVVNRDVPPDTVYGGVPAHNLHG